MSLEVESITQKEFTDAQDAINCAKHDLLSAIIDHGNLKSERDDLKSAYDANAEEIRDQGIEAAYQGVSLIFIAKLGPLAGATAVQELRDAITRAHLTALDLQDQARLSKALDIAINKTQELRDTIGEPQSGTEQATGLFLKRD